MNVGGVSSGFSSAQQGMARAAQKTLAAVQSVSEATGKGDVGRAVEAVLDLRSANVETQAVAAFAKAQNEMMGSVLDLLA